VNFANKKERESVMPDAAYQIVTLKRAVARHGVVCRVRSDRGRVRVDVFWRPPRVRRSMRPFMSAMPLALIKELTGSGFAGVDDVPIDGLFTSGIVAASFASDAAEAPTVARAVIASHGLADSDRVVAWAPRGGESRRRGRAKGLASLTAVPGSRSRDPQSEWRVANSE
jgi:hypothetical protein